MITLLSRRNSRKLLNQLEEDLERRKKVIENQKNYISKKEEEFFSEQVGKYFESKSGKRFFKILSYEKEGYQGEWGVYNINYFDLKDKIEHKDKLTTYYTVFGLDFEIQEITEKEYNKHIGENK